MQLTIPLKILFHAQKLVNCCKRINHRDHNATENMINCCSNACSARIIQWFFTDWFVVSGMIEQITLLESRFNECGEICGIIVNEHSVFLFHTIERMQTFARFVDEEICEILCSSDCIRCMRNVSIDYPFVDVFLGMELDAIKWISKCLMLNNYQSNSKLNPDIPCVLESRYKSLAIEVIVFRQHFPLSIYSECC